MTPKPNPPRRVSPAVLFREQIERAEAEGLSRPDMTLRLTHGDIMLLKRDRSLALADISFAGGVMRYLGVKVEVEAAGVSELITSA